MALDGMKNSLSENQFQEILKWTWFSEIAMFTILPLTKISIGFFILRFNDSGWLKWFLYGLMTGLVLTYGACIIVLLAQCRPIRAYWNRSAGACWNIKIYNDVIWIQAGYSILSDVAYTFLPLVVLWNIQISFRHKLGISGLMSLGSL